MSVFIDTNVLVYRFDKDTPGKQKIAQQRYVELVRIGEALDGVTIEPLFFRLT